jgi:hypothetical protein
MLRGEEDDILHFFDVFQKTFLADENTPVGQGTPESRDKDLRWNYLWNPEYNLDTKEIQFDAKYL